MYSDSSVRQAQEFTEWPYLPLSLWEYWLIPIQLSAISHFSWWFTDSMITVTIFISDRQWLKLFPVLAFITQWKESLDFKMTDGPPYDESHNPTKVLWLYWTWQTAQAIVSRISFPPHHNIVKLFLCQAHSPPFIFSAFATSAHMIILQKSACLLSRMTNYLGLVPLM